MKRLRDAANGVDFNRFRFWFQLAAFGLLVYGGYAGIELGNSLPTFSCGYNSEGRGGMCYLMNLQHQLAWPWERLFSAAAVAVATALGLFLLWFAVLNKAWCGFVCPLGTIQDWITALRRRLGVRYARYTGAQFRQLTRIKYLLLVLMILLPLGIGAAVVHKDMRVPFCQICPGRLILPAFTGHFSQWSIDFSTKTALAMTALGVIITGLFLVGAFVKKRFFCFFCPMSALHFIFSKLALLRLQKEGSKCTRCGDCYRVCDMEIREIADEVKQPQIMMDDCTLCLKCVAACPEPGALTATFVGIPIFESTEAGFLKRMQKGLSVTSHDQ